MRPPEGKIQPARQGDPIWGRLLHVRMYLNQTPAKRARLVDTLEDCEAVTAGVGYTITRCSRKAKYEAEGVVLYEFNSTVEDSPTETRGFCTQHSRNSYNRVIVRAKEGN